jgi:hypothetical protein
MSKKHDCSFTYSKKDIRKCANTEPVYYHREREQKAAARIFDFFVDNLKGDNPISEKIRCELNMYNWEAYKIGGKLRIQRFDGEKWIILNTKNGNSYYYDIDLRGFIEIADLELTPNKYIFHPDDYDIPMLSKCCLNIFKICANLEELPKGWYELSPKLPEYQKVIKACFIPNAVLIRVKEKARRYSFIWEYQVGINQLCCVKYVASYYVFSSESIKKIHKDYIDGMPKFLNLPNIYKIELPIVKVVF